MPVATVVPSTIPVTIHPDAAARVDELGLRAEFERMLEHTLENAPGLLSVNVVLAMPHDTGDDPVVVIEATRPLMETFPVEVEQEWAYWKYEAFSSAIGAHFVMLLVPDAAS